MARPQHALRDGRKPGWFYIDDTLIDQHGAAIGAIGIAVYAALARHADRAGHATLAYQTIADAVGSSRNTVIRTLRKLADEELITIENQTDEAGNPIAANVYTLCVIPDQKRGGAPGGVPTVAPPRPTAAPGGYPQLHPPDPQLHPGGPTVAYEGHDPSLEKDHDPPPPPPLTPPKPDGGGGDEKENRREEPERTDLYHWLRANGVDSPEAAERNQHHDPEATRALHRRMVGDASGDERRKRIGRFIKALDADGPPPLTNSPPLAYTPPARLSDGALPPERRAALAKELWEQEQRKRQP